jgi:hypothetical protein
LTIPTFELWWNSRRVEWRQHGERAPWIVEAVLLERVILAGKPQLRIVCRIASVSENRLVELPTKSEKRPPQLAASQQ